MSVGLLLSSAMEVLRSNLRSRKRMARINPISNVRVLVFKPIVDCSMSHLCLFPQGRSCGGMFLFAVSLQKPRLRLNTGHTHTHTMTTSEIDWNSWSLEHTVNSAQSSSIGLRPLPQLRSTSLLLTSLQYHFTNQ